MDNTITTKDKEHKNLKILKETYDLFKKKYSLPEFKFMNENFEIENIDAEETELFLKVVRKHMTEKVFYILRTFEMFISPSNAPLFIMNMIKLFSESDNELIKEIYLKLGNYEIEAFGLEAEYDEKKEAEFIKKFSEDWKEISRDLKVIYSAMKDNHRKDAKKQQKSYFG